MTGIVRHLKEVCGLFGPPGWSEPVAIFGRKRSYQPFRQPLFFDSLISLRHIFRASQCVCACHAFAATSGFADVNNMFIRKAHYVYHVVFVYYGHRAVIPCAVSDPSFNVTLVHAASLQDFNRKDGVTFDPMEGFIVASPYYVWGGTFTCKARAFLADGSVWEEESRVVLKYQGECVSRLSSHCPRL